MSENLENCTHDCSTCGENCPSREGPQSFLEKTNDLSHVKKVIGVVSGKGGVGKSLVTSLLATTLRRRELSVGVLDADITGPSIPKCFGLKGKCMADENGMYPMDTKTGVKVMSINLLLDEETTPVVWRGPVIAGAIKQFWTDVVWGDVDSMFVDLPPGTGDAPRTVVHDRLQGCGNGKNDGCACAGPGGEHELCPVPGLRQALLRVRGEPH